MDCILLKVDFMQAYDCVNLEFLRFMLRKLGFCSKLMNGWNEGFSQVACQS